ncbi:stage III sporulation protein AA [Ornithinibacillus halophilus]|uniref:Stage III sporulation protein AA n=1 Tax=Ornithinibacillus halophilus TaxID=930117 RepID=A0A1M5CZ37_9BACI|nr:stage III sporulation protein AA [Ornithinibacillus halophilus]SHF59998.1 stage III sporulation protein AA [Ornithinibacillus halophilus]
MQEILRLFPGRMSNIIQSSILNRWDKLQEIRIRISKPIELIFDNQIEWVEQLLPTSKEAMFIINQLSEFSLYRLEDELREGYITIEGGHRVGLAGKVNTRKGSVKAIQHISFLNIRIAKQKIGAAIPIIPYLYDKQYLNTLFVGAPQTGKTTLIRDCTRIISSGWKGIEPKKVGVVDERSEIGACLKGVPQHDLGKRTDVLDACPKAEGMMMMIRSMSPDIMVVDEIGSAQDVQALLEAINAGVIVFCTIHGQSLEELKKRPSLQQLLSQNIFKRIVILKNDKSPGKIEKILNEKEENIFHRTRMFAK